jgi:hypothetical protein
VDFGDGTPAVTVKSIPTKPDCRDALAPDGYATSVHRFAEPGEYFVRVAHTEGDVSSTARLHVLIQ